MARAAVKKKAKMFYATMHVTRVEQWCVEAETADEARLLLASGGGHKCDAGECLHADVHAIDDG
jgi:hypothetical protein